MKAKPFPALQPSETLEGALGDLAGAMMVVAELYLAEHGKEESSVWSLIFFSSLRQWMDSGFADGHARAVANMIHKTIEEHP